MRIQRKIYNTVAGLLVSLFFLSSCLVDEKIYTEEEEINPGDEIVLTLPLQLPHSPGILTRADLEENETNIEMLQVLVFEPDGGKYLYTASTTQVVTEDAENPHAKKAKLKMIFGASEDNVYDFVFLANAADLISAAHSGGISKELNKQEVLKEIIYRKEGRLVTGNNSFEPIPMWGSLDCITISAGNNDLTPAVEMVRMVARVDVVLDEEITKADKFTLTSVHVYNPTNKGYVAPIHGWDKENYTQPVIPSGTILQDNSIVYDSTDEVRDSVCSGVVYLFEAWTGTEDLLQNTCLVIGGIYKEKTYYYRLDFVEKDDQGETVYMPVLRSLRYMVSIKDVRGAGYDTPDDAFNSAPMNIEADIVKWNEVDMNNIYFDGQYYLSINQKSFKFSREERNEYDTDNKLKITTDYPGGWKIDSISWSNGESGVKYQSDLTKGWIDASNWGSNAFQGDKISSTIDIIVEQNNTPYDRTGEVYLSAGRIICTVKVSQTNQMRLSVTIVDETGEEITELVFPGNIGGTLIDPKEFTVSWSPRTETVRINVTEFGNELFNYDVSRNSDRIENNTALNLEEGKFTYTIVPPNLTQQEVEGYPYYEKGSMVDFTITNGAIYVSKTIYLRQLHYGLTCETDEPYLLDGEVHSLMVKSNAFWTASLVNGGNVISELVTNSGPANTTTGYPLQFRTTDHMENFTLLTGTARIRFEAPGGEFEPVEIEVECGLGKLEKESNSYIVRPGGPGILIPVSRANRYIDNSIGEDDELEVELLWTDNSYGIGENAAISTMYTVGKGSAGYLLIFPGNVEGNALVAVKVNGQIKWSWHIWVTNFNPETSRTYDHSNGYHTYRFMDRNLGALVAADVEAGTRNGLTYQWGRKDPFPGSSGIRDNLVETPIYNKEGITEIEYITNMQATIETAIANPMTFYRGLISNSWGVTNDTLWNGGVGNAMTIGHKTIFDPCPAGWRVPANETGYPWNGLDFNYDNSTFRLSTAAGTYFVTGFRSMGSLVVPNAGVYWTGSRISAESAHAFYINLYNDSYNLANRNASLAFACAIRCVRE